MPPRESQRPVRRRVDTGTLESRHQLPTPVEAVVLAPVVLEKVAVSFTGPSSVTVCEASLPEYDPGPVPLHETKFHPGLAVALSWVVAPASYPLRPPLNRRQGASSQSSADTGGRTSGRGCLAALLYLTLRRGAISHYRRFPRPKTEPTSSCRRSRVP